MAYGRSWHHPLDEQVWKCLGQRGDGKLLLTACKVYRTWDVSKADVFDYMVPLYDPRRRYSTLGYLSSVEYEEQAKQA